MFQQQLVNNKAKKLVIRFEDAMHSLLEVALFLLQASRGCIMLLDKTGSILQVKFAKGYQDKGRDSPTSVLGEGIAGWVAKSGVPLVIPSIAEERLFINQLSPDAAGGQVKTIICVPLRLKGKVIGVVNIDDNGLERTFLEEDLQTITPLMVQMEKALERAFEEGEEKLFKSAVHFDNLSQVFQELNMVYSKKELGPVFLSSAQELFPQADSGFLMLEEDCGNLLQVIASFGDIPTGLCLPTDFHQNASCFIKDYKKAFLISDRSAFKTELCHQLKEYHAKSMLVAPMVVDHLVKGLIIIGSSFPNSFRKCDLHLLQIITGQISLIYRTGTSYSDLKFYSNDMLESVTVGVVCVDLAGKITLVNHVAEGIFGICRNDLLGKNFYTFHQGPELEKIEEAKQMLLVTGKPVENLQVTINKINGYRKTLKLGMNLLRNSKGVTLGFTVVFEDITEKLILEEQLRRTERLVVAGQLAAGAAHEIKNPLTTIKGFSQMLKSSLIEGDVRISYLETVLNEIEQINFIINEMDRLAVKEPGNVDWLDVPLLIDEMLQDERKEGNLAQISVETIYDNGIPPILGNQIRLKQVFFQLIRNALESMKEGGAIVIKVFINNLDEVSVHFSDTGIGIPEEEIELIFNPFYTKRPDGVGLGLAISYKTIREHGGTMEIESEFGKGTSVMLRLPVNFHFADLLYS